MRPSSDFSFGSSPTAFGAPGVGGSFGFADPATGIGYAYVTNRLGFNVFDDVREQRLRREWQTAFDRLQEEFLEAERRFDDDPVGFDEFVDDWEARYEAWEESSEEAWESWEQDLEDSLAGLPPRHKQAWEAPPRAEGTLVASTTSVMPQVCRGKEGH